MRLAELSMKTWIGAEHGVSRAKQNETIGRTVKKKKSTVNCIYDK